MSDDVAALAQEIEALQAELAVVEAHVSDAFEWIRRGDGSWVLYKNGQICGDRAEINAHLAERPS